MPGMSRPPCEICQRPASFTDSVPDPTKQGINLNECGYRNQFLCMAHGMDRKRVNTARVEPLNLPVTCDTCGATWEDNHPNAPSDIIWCGDCQR